MMVEPSNFKIRRYDPAFEYLPYGPKIVKEDQDGREFVTVPGVDFSNARPEIVYRRDAWVVIRRSGHQYWAGRGTTGYMGAQYSLVRIDKVSDVEHGWHLYAECHPGRYWRSCLTTFKEMVDRNAIYESSLQNSDEVQQIESFWEHVTSKFVYLTDEEKAIIEPYEATAMEWGTSQVTFRVLMATFPEGLPVERRAKAALNVLREVREKALQDAREGKA